MKIRTFKSMDSTRSVLSKKPKKKQVKTDLVEDHFRDAMAYFARGWQSVPQPQSDFKFGGKARRRLIFPDCFVLPDWMKI